MKLNWQPENDTRTTLLVNNVNMNEYINLYKLRFIANSNSYATSQ